jgi:hypothetical protein
MIKKQELIDRLKNGETMLCLFGWGNKRDSYSIDMERVHITAAVGLIKRKEVKLLKRSHSSAEYVWNGEKS